MGCIITDKPGLLNFDQIKTQITPIVYSNGSSEYYFLAAYLASGIIATRLLAGQSAGILSNAAFFA